MADWYYIGHYGQLGPLTREQVDELVIGGVIDRSTYVWQTGMSDWLRAERVPELKELMEFATPYGVPPPPPPGPTPPAPQFNEPPVPLANQFSKPPTAAQEPMSTSYAEDVYRPVYAPYSRLSQQVPSNRSRTTAGVLQLIFPGVGRMYLGYLAYGTLQLVLTLMSCGAMHLWSLIDGIFILTGGVKLDGYGRHLQE